MAQTDAREYLRQVRKIELLIQNKLAEREYWKSVATSTTASMDDERVQTSKNPQKMANAVCRYVDIEREIDRAVDALYDVKAEVIATLEQLDVEEYDVLYKRFIQFMTIFETSEACDMSPSWVKSVQRRGIDSVQAIIDAKD